MDKEKEIREMAYVLCSYPKIPCNECVLKLKGCCWQTNAEQLYNAGYRKADEVRKETAKEILQKMYDIVFGEEVPELGQAPYGIGRKEILYFAKMYGVEID